MFVFLEQLYMCPYQKGYLVTTESQCCCYYAAGGRKPLNLRLWRRH